MRQLDYNSGRTMFSMWSVPRCYKQWRRLDYVRSSEWTERIPGLEAFSDLKETCVGQSGYCGFNVTECDHANFTQFEQLRVVQEARDIDCV
jgi:hypothetical protein